ncbi:glycosyltransferase family 2 protein [Confluentibacter citreus]|uniref:glycosyltransferase family 2 protein n=1 Tax=Confluentibacter citreus TaxID=2007307 RepID=UPI000C2825D2|nr:glycosyltransferase family 2 protein [Confluentibacter citreus]
MTELSVLLMAFNSEDYIEDALKSILKQKCSYNFEIIVGDDCSTDKTFEILNNYAIKYPNLFNIKTNTSQLGILKNFKATLDRCNGNFVFNFDADDVIKSDVAFQKIIDILKHNPNLGFIDSGYDKLLNDGKTIVEFDNKENILVSNEEYKERLLLGKVIPIGVCFNRESLYKYVDFDYYIKENITIEDYPILVDMVMHCDFDRINESLHIYRIHPSSYSHKNCFERIYFLRNQMQKLFLYFSSKYNFSEKLKEIYLKNHYKSVLADAGNYEKKTEGKAAFKAIKNKKILDIIHYLASQYPWIRNVIRLRKKLYLKLLK